MSGPDTTAQPTRWELVQRGEGTDYADTFARLVAEGADVDGEARLADALLARGSTVLDVGSGMGRVSAALAVRGHLVTAIEPDPALVAQSLRTYPDLDVVVSDVLAFDPAAHGAPRAYDLVVAVGNVLVFLTPETERAVLARMRALLAPAGRILIGYHAIPSRAGARAYPAAEFIADATAAGLSVAGRFGSYDLRPPDEEYAVWLLTAAN